MSEPQITDTPTETGTEVKTDPPPPPEAPQSSQTAFGKAYMEITKARDIAAEKLVTAKANAASATSAVTAAEDGFINATRDSLGTAKVLRARLDEDIAEYEAVLSPGV